MRSKPVDKFALLLMCLVFAVSVGAFPTVRSRLLLPNPILMFTGAEPVTTGGKSFIRYHYEVFNRESYPAEMFAASPQLPPCGKNTRSSRTWVDIYDQTGKRLYGFCALGNPNELNSIFFAMEEGVVPPSWIYIELDDRQTDTKYKSNLAETVL